MFGVRRILPVLALVLVLSFCLCAVPVVVRAQTATGVIGNISDPQGAIIPGATITLTSKATGASRSTLSNEAGYYAIPQLTPGTYSLKIEMVGFKTVAMEVDILINTTPRVDVQFKEIGGITDTVIVESTATQVNTTDATIGNAFNEVQVRELPMEGRNAVGLLSLQPGVTYLGENLQTSDTRSGAVNGGRSDQANVTLDAVDV